jgi:hypothetical protein
LLKVVQLADKGSGGHDFTPVTWIRFPVWLPPRASGTVPISERKIKDLPWEKEDSQGSRTAWRFPDPRTEIWRPKQF